MSPPVVSLSSLASRVVLAQNLDTRELPKHLHRQMEQYRRMRGDFYLLSVDLQVHGSGNEEVTEKDRKYERRWFDKIYLGNMVRDSGLEMKLNGKNRWTSTKVDGQKIPVNFKEDPVTRLNNIEAFQQTKQKRPNITLSSYGYLENGKLLTIEKMEQFWPSVGLTTVTTTHSSFEIDDTDCLVEIQKSKNSYIGRTHIITIRKTRS